VEKPTAMLLNKHTTPEIGGMKKINKKQLASMYNMSRTTLTVYLSEHLHTLRKLATTSQTGSGRTIVKRDLNSAQLACIVEVILNYTPDGYEFDGTSFVALKE